MAIRNQPLVVDYTAWNTSTNGGQTGDAANHTLTVYGDGVPFTPGESPSEANSAKSPGTYLLALQASEMNYSAITITGVSSTSNVVIIPRTVTTDGYVASGTGTRVVTQDYGGAGTYTVENSSSQPIQGATVTAYLAASYAANPLTAAVVAYTTTDVNGHWTLYLLPGSYTLTFAAPGDTPSSANVSVV